MNLMRKKNKSKSVTKKQAIDHLVYQNGKVRIEGSAKHVKAIARLDYAKIFLRLLIIGGLGLILRNTPDIISFLSQLERGP